MPFSSYAMTTEQLLKTLAESHMEECMYARLSGTTVQEIVTIEGKTWLFLKTLHELFVVRTETQQVWTARIDPFFLAKKG